MFFSPKVFVLPFVFPGFLFFQVFFFFPGYLFCGCSKASSKCGVLQGNWHESQAKLLGVFFRCHLWEVTGSNRDPDASRYVYIYIYKYVYLLCIYIYIYMFVLLSACKHCPFCISFRSDFSLAVSRSKTRRRVCGLGAWVQRTAQIEKCNRLVELGTQA